MLGRKSVKIFLALSILAVGLYSNAESRSVGTDSPSKRWTENTDVQIGALVENPEMVTGVWEMQVAQKKYVGLSIALIATVNGSAVDLRNAKQYVKFIRITTYVRSPEGTKVTWWNSSAPGTFSWHRNRLQLHYIGTKIDPSLMDLDLTLELHKSLWEGTLATADYSGRVALTRPNGVDPKVPVGTWLQWITFGDTSQFGCLHIALSTDNHWVAWSDAISSRGQLYSGDSIRLSGAADSTRADESYGQLLEDPMPAWSGDSWSFRLGNALGGDQISGKLSEDGLLFTGDADHYGNGFTDPSHAGRPFTWYRVMGDSCVPSVFSQMIKRT